MITICGFNWAFRYDFFSRTLEILTDIGNWNLSTRRQEYCSSVKKGLFASISNFPMVNQVITACKHGLSDLHSWLNSKATFAATWRTYGTYSTVHKCKLMFYCIIWRLLFWLSSTFSFLDHFDDLSVLYVRCCSFQDTVYLNLQYLSFGVRVWIPICVFLPVRPTSFPFSEQTGQVEKEKRICHPLKRYKNISWGG